MSHIDDVLDARTLPNYVHEFLEHARRPAVLKDHKWLESHRPSCDYGGERYVLVGASRLGDVWLKGGATASPNAFYDLRVDIDECSNWIAP